MQIIIYRFLSTITLCFIPYIYIYTAPSLFHLQMERRLRSHSRASIVQFLEQRAVTGRMPAMEAHLHSYYVVVLWKIEKHDVDERCFTDYIVRCTSDNETYRQLRECMQRFDQGRHCTFGHHCANNVSAHTSGEDPTYVPKKDRHSLKSQWVRDASAVTCPCPEVTSSRYRVGELITMCCFKHSTIKIVSRLFGNSANVLNTNFVMAKRIR
jgi:hypothetical protein